MKRFFLATGILLLILSITACTADVSEQETITDTTVVTTAEKETTALFDEATTEIKGTASVIVEETTTEPAVTEHTTAKQNTTDKVTEKHFVTAKPVETTKKSVSTTKKPVTTTKKPEVATKPSKKLPDYYPETEIMNLYNKINDYRTQNGLNKLTLDPELCKIAYVRAEEQEVLQGHNRPDGSKYYSALDEYNYEYSGCGENIAFLTGLSDQVAFNAWQTSSSHNQNMLDASWTKCGLALYISADGCHNIVNLFAC